MKKTISLLAMVIMSACGGGTPTSTVMEGSQTVLSEGSFSNNSLTGFDMVTSSANLTVSEAFIHVPANNLYGNRYLILSFAARNVAFEKHVQIARESKWYRADFAGIPSEGPRNGQAYVRYLRSEGQLDYFVAVLHDAMFNPLPMVELKISQGGQTDYVKLRLKNIESPPRRLDFVTSVARDEVRVTGITGYTFERNLWLKISVDVADIDYRKLFQVACTSCSGAWRYSRTVKFDGNAQAVNGAGGSGGSRAVFVSEADGREQINLLINLGGASVQEIRELDITYVAPGYTDTPTYGAEDGVFGTRYRTRVVVQSE